MHVDVTALISEQPGIADKKISYVLMMVAVNPVIYLKLLYERRQFSGESAVEFTVPVLGRIVLIGGYVMGNDDSLSVKRF